MLKKFLRKPLWLTGNVMLWKEGAGIGGGGGGGGYGRASEQQTSCQPALLLPTNL